MGELKQPRVHVHVVGIVEGVFGGLFVIVEGGFRMCFVRGLYYNVGEFEGAYDLEKN